MFHSATVKLTGWYLLILMGISILFSIAIYGITTEEINQRLNHAYDRIQRQDESRIDPILAGPYVAFLEAQQEEANHNIFAALLYVNLIILLGGGALSYWLARRTLANLEAAHIAQSRFTSDASHELRTPLAAMKMELEVALRDFTLTKTEMRELLASNLEEVDKLSRLSHLLLQLSRAEHANLDMSEVALRPLIESVVARYDKSGTRTRIQAATNTPSVLGHADSLEELATILVDNAIKYSPDDTVVEIKLSRRSGKACLEVINSGKGIPAEKLPYIFDRFYRVDGSRTGGKTSGYGLGLALAKQIVALHHGDLSATSAENHATTFTALLPMFKKNRTKQQA